MALYRETGTRRRFIAALLVCAWFLLTAYAAGTLAADKGVAGVTEATIQAERPRRWAALIGVDKYEDEHGIGSLRYCCKDMRLLCDVLTGPTGGFDRKQVLLMTSDAEDPLHRPTYANVIRMVPRWLRDARTEDDVLIAFSGHGFAEEGKAYLLPSDAVLQNVRLTGISLSLLYEWMDACKAERKILIVDACHSGAGKAPAKMSRSFAAGLRTGKGYVRLASCSAEQKSNEDAQLGHGVFTYYLAEGLTGAADNNRDGRIDVDELYAHVFEDVRSWARAKGLEQDPMKEGSVVGILTLGYHVPGADQGLAMSASVPSAADKPLALWWIGLAVLFAFVLFLAWHLVRLSRRTGGLASSELAPSGSAVSGDGPISRRPAAIPTDSPRLPRAHPAEEPVGNVEMRTTQAEQVPVEVPCNEAPDMADDGYPAEDVVTDISFVDEVEILAPEDVVTDVAFQDEEEILAPEVTLYTGWPFDAQEARRRQQETAGALGIGPGTQLDLGHGVTMELALIPAGEFMMGTGGSRADEKPVHRVRITKGFYMSVTPVTEAQWKAVTGEEPWRGLPLAGRSDSAPATYISYSLAQEFCEQFSEDTGRVVRMPTEAEWEYACRGGSTTAYYFGDDPAQLSDYAWYGRNAGDVGAKYAHDVAHKEPNAWGLHDMHGNVWEWCSDWYRKSYYANSPGEDPQGPGSGVHRVLRGGSWHADPIVCRSAQRTTCPPDYGLDRAGLRVVVAV